MEPPIIGIIGGMGPQAGLDLAEKVIAETTAAKDQEHLPMALLSYGHKIGDRSAYVFGEITKNPGFAIASVARTLAELGVRVAGIPCNSAHAPEIFNALTNSLKDLNIRILHLIPGNHSIYTGSSSGYNSNRMSVNTECSSHRLVRVRCKTCWPYSNYAPATKSRNML